jgi:hypothetical protein
MIIVECDSDTRLVRLLGIPKNKIRHGGHGRGDVLNRLGEVNESIGLIDEDPGVNPPKNKEEYDMILQWGGLSLFKHQKNPSRCFIQISPRLEEWLLSCAKRSEMNPQDFGFPSSGNELHRINHYEKRPMFEAFVQKLLSRDFEMKKLQEIFLKELM